MRVRLLALLSAAALFSLTAVPASASNDAHGYLALGDSVAFGYNPILVHGGQAGDPGCPDIAAKTLSSRFGPASTPAFASSTAGSGTWPSPANSFEGCRNRNQD